MISLPTFVKWCVSWGEGGGGAIAVKELKEVVIQSIVMLI